MSRRARIRQLEVLVVDGSRPVAAPPPATVREDAYGWVAVCKSPGSVRLRSR